MQHGTVSFITDEPPKSKEGDEYVPYATRQKANTCQKKCLLALAKCKSSKKKAMINYSKL